MQPEKIAEGLVALVAKQERGLRLADAVEAMVTSYAIGPEQARYVLRQTLEKRSIALGKDLRLVQASG